MLPRSKQDWTKRRYSLACHYGHRVINIAECWAQLMESRMEYGTHIRWMYEKTLNQAVRLFDHDVNAYIVDRARDILAQHWYYHDDFAPIARELQKKRWRDTYSNISYRNQCVAVHFYYSPMTHHKFDEAHRGYRTEIRLPYTANYAEVTEEIVTNMISMVTNARLRFNEDIIRSDLNIIILAIEHVREYDGPIDRKFPLPPLKIGKIVAIGITPVNGVYRKVYAYHDEVILSYLLKGKSWDDLIWEPYGSAHREWFEYNASAN